MTLSFALSIVAPGSGITTPSTLKRMTTNAQTKWAILFRDEPYNNDYLWVKRLGQGAFARADLVRAMNGRLEVRKLLHQPAFVDARMDTIKAEILTMIDIRQACPSPDLALARLNSAGFTSGISDQGRNNGDRNVGYWKFYNLGSCLDLMQLTSRLDLYIPSAFAAGLVADCLFGLENLLHTGKTHNDLYPRNIFLNARDLSGCSVVEGVIGDFGLCATLPHPPHMRRVCDMKTDLLALSKCVKFLAENRRPALEIELIQVSMEVIQQPLYPPDSPEKQRDECRWWKIQSILDLYVSQWTNPSTTISTFIDGITAFTELKQEASRDFRTAIESTTFATVLQGIADETVDAVPTLFDSFEDLRRVAEQEFKGEMIQTVKILTSPLLRLPAELRLRIYELLLDVGQISIDYRVWTPHTKARPGFYCRTLASDADPWASPPAHHREVVCWDPALRGHDASGGRGAGKVAKTGATSGGVTLLSGVCRQLYHETATLPFQLNTWSFHSPRLMNRYLKERRMTLKQRRAVKILIVKEKPSKAVENMFGCLQVVAWRDEAKVRLIRERCQ
ncbi:hypothetical protein PpBr36_07295 [Pyricularia pennisetigena]|uniref:hypothetical protein n=1 Tax=Pyricularia pennisetigena TaxID=1578925 RepID=UPI00114DC2FF|nr:hypothetical protein PpBr36_07295 [Pyricularia pennisetigena]TLS25047.1 hypothetical protein PpBr36_07295 [Pyricularia pennisetigena]